LVVQIVSAHFARLETFQLRLGESVSDENQTASKAAVPSIPAMCIGGTSLNAHLSQNPITGRVEILRLTPDGKKGDVISAFPTDRAAWVWAAQQYKLGKLPFA
jgi:hypothetical protein